MTRRRRGLTVKLEQNGETRFAIPRQVEAHIVRGSSREDDYLWLGGEHGPCVATLSGERLRMLADLLAPYRSEA